MGEGTKRKPMTPEQREAHAKRMREHPPRLGTSKVVISARDGVDGKHCKTCKEWRPLEKFARHKECAGGRRHFCTTCEGRRAYAGNPAARIAGVRRWQKAHPEHYDLIRVAGRKLRKGKAMPGVGVKVAELRMLLVGHNGLCAYCKTNPSTEFDHRIPIARGGLNEIGNLTPCCSPCNMSKFASTLEEWTARMAAAGV